MTELLNPDERNSSHNNKNKETKKGSPHSSLLTLLYYHKNSFTQNTACRTATIIYAIYPLQSEQPKHQRIRQKKPNKESSTRNNNVESKRL